MLAHIVDLQQLKDDTLWAVIKGLLEPDPRHRLNAAQALAMPVFQQVNEPFKHKQVQQQAFNVLKTALKETELTSKQVPLAVSQNQTENYPRGLFRQPDAPIQIASQDKPSTAYTSRIPNSNFFNPVSPVASNVQQETTGGHSHMPQYN